MDLDWAEQQMDGHWQHRESPSITTLTGRHPGWVSLAVVVLILLGLLIGWLV